MQPEDETKQKMLDILKRFHSEEESDFTDEDGLYYYDQFIGLQFFILLNSKMEKSNIGSCCLSDPNSPGTWIGNDLFICVINHIYAF